MINNGMFAAVHYTGKLAGGEIFDSSENGDPLEFEIGSESVIPEFEKQIVMMNIGEEKEFLVKAGDAYGEYSDTYIEKVPLSEMKNFLEPKEGLVIEVMMPDGMHHPAKIKSVTESDVELDFNHPLAGKDLMFKVKLVEVNPEAKYNTEEESCGDDCDCDGDCDCGDDCECDDDKDKKSGGCNCGCGH